MKCDTAFATLKNCLTSAPVIDFPHYSKSFILDKDVSQERIGAVLSQECDGQERVVAYASITMNKAECKYSVTRKELLAVVTLLISFTLIFCIKPFYCALTIAPWPGFKTSRSQKVS